MVKQGLTVSLEHSQLPTPFVSAKHFQVWLPHNEWNSLKLKTEQTQNKDNYRIGSQSGNSPEAEHKLSIEVTHHSQEFYVDQESMMQMEIVTH